MLTTTKFGGLAAAVALAISLTGAAQAAPVNISWTAQPGSAVANQLAAATTGTVYENVTGSQSDRLSPWGDGTSPYTSISGDASATYYFGTALRTVLSFVWGSPDTYNVVEFYNGNSLVTSVSPLEDNISGNIANSLATLTLSGGDVFNTVKFRSLEQNALEFSNLAASPVPVPAAGLLLVGALGGLAALRRRKALAA